MKTCKKLIKSISSITILAMIIQTSACGTLLYPERRNSPSPEQIEPAGRRIDPGVAVLNGILCIPPVTPIGIIAFGVDFFTGAIYIGNNMKKKTSVKAEN